jgi:hypothetical protein
VIARAGSAVDKDRPGVEHQARMTQSAVPAAEGTRTATRIRYAWLFSRRADLGMLLLPLLVTGGALAVALRLGEDFGGGPRGYAGWATAFLLGNTSHVLLTFLLLGTRRDMLHATPRQATTVILTSLFVFALAMVLMRLTDKDPWTRPFYETVTVVFATHHTLSQAKGFWALYGLRGAQAGLPPASARERELQKLFVPLALLFIAVKWTLVGRNGGVGAPPYMNVNPGEGAVLPFLVTHGLVLAWLAYVAVLFRALVAYDELNGAKLFYLGAQCLVVTLELLSPGWGVTLAAGIHGLEYYFLTRKMLAPTAGEAQSRLTSALCWPAMIAAMSPILMVGVMKNPWSPFAVSFGPWALMAVNASVLAHYAADAFIYRFRIPGVRRVALARLGFGS